MKTKNNILIAGCYLIVLSFVFLFGCSTPQNTNNNTGSQETDSQEDFVELTLSNYNYYLTIDRTQTDSGSVSYGSYRWATYKVTIYGAVSGIYKNCSLSYKKTGSDTETEIKLNASGYGSFSITLVNYEEFQFTKASGKIYY